MVHMVRSSLKYVASKDMKSVASDRKTTIYNAVSEDERQKARQRVVEKWSGKSFTPRMRWKVCIPVTENSSVGAVCSQATRLC